MDGENLDLNGVNSEPKAVETTPEVQGTNALDFVPEEYRDRDWIKKYKSREDFFKGVDSLQNLTGKKLDNLAPDFEKATDDELRAYYAKTAPKSVKDYGFEFEDEGGILETMKENGLTKKQAKAVMDKYFSFARDNYEKTMNRTLLEKEIMELHGNDARPKAERFKSAVNKYAKGGAEVIKGMTNAQYKAVFHMVDNIFNDFDLSSDSPSFNNAGIFTVGNSKQEYDKMLDEYHNEKTPRDRKEALRSKIMNYKFASEAKNY
jgi:hypothetical protein